MIPIQVPVLQDVALYPVFNQISLLAVQKTDIIKAGTFSQRPTSGGRFFFYATDIKQWFAYCNDVSVGDNGWIMIG